MPVATAAEWATGRDIALAHLVWYVTEPPPVGRYDMAACGVEIDRLQRPGKKQPRCGICREMQAHKLEGAWIF